MTNYQKFAMHRTAARNMAATLGTRRAAGFLRNRGYSVELARVMLFGPVFA